LTSAILSSKKIGITEDFYQLRVSAGNLGQRRKFSRRRRFEAGFGKES
jgi:hypothetical protein